MAEKKVFEGLFPESVSLNPLLGLLERQNFPIPVESLTIGWHQQQSWTFLPQVMCLLPGL